MATRHFQSEKMQTLPTYSRQYVLCKGRRKECKDIKRSIDTEREINKLRWILNSPIADEVARKRKREDFSLRNELDQKQPLKVY
jgi:hypothetical protein